MRLRENAPEREGLKGSLADDYRTRSLDYPLQGRAARPLGGIMMMTVRVSISIGRVFSLRTASGVWRRMRIVVRGCKLSSRRGGVMLGLARVPSKGPFGVAQNQDSEPKQQRKRGCDTQAHGQFPLSDSHMLSNIATQISDIARAYALYHQQGYT